MLEKGLRADAPRSPPGNSRVTSTYSLPPTPHTYTSPVLRGYTSRWQSFSSSAQNSAAGSFATASEAS